MSKTRQLPYFYDSANQVSSWEAPAGLDEAAVYALPGASQYLVPPPGSSSNASGGSGSIQASHILVKHNKSRRPSSHREKVITRSPEEAEATIRGFIEQLGPNPDPSIFAEIAAENRYVSLCLVLFLVLFLFGHNLLAQIRTTTMRYVTSAWLSLFTVTAPRPARVETSARSSEGKCKSPSRMLPTVCPWVASAVSFRPNLGRTSFCARPDQPL